MIESDPFTVRFPGPLARLKRRIRYVWRLVTFRGRKLNCCICDRRYLHVQNPSWCPRCGVLQAHVVVKWPPVTEAEVREAAKKPPVEVRKFDRMEDFCKAIAERIIEDGPEAVK